MVSMDLPKVNKSISKYFLGVVESLWGIGSHMIPFSAPNKSNETDMNVSAEIQNLMEHFK